MATLVSLFSVITRDETNVLCLWITARIYNDTGFTVFRVNSLINNNIISPWTISLYDSEWSVGDKRLLEAESRTHIVFPQSPSSPSPKPEGDSAASSPPPSPEDAPLPSPPGTYTHVVFLESPRLMKTLCLRFRERERDRDGERDREIERER